MKDRAREDEPVGVDASPTHAGETRPRKERDPGGWIERAIWTERMLGALVTGPRGGKWHSLMDKVSAERSLRAGWARVQSNRGAAGVDRVSCERFGSQSERYLKELSDELRSGQYQPLPVRRRWIPKPGRKEQRPLGIPAVRDRVVQATLRMVLEPIWESRFNDNSFGFRPGRGCKDALRRVATHLEAEHPWVVDADIRSFFDRIDHEVLMRKIREHVADRSVLHLVEGYLKQRIVDEMKTWSPDLGTPQGAVISPLLANIYLSSLDARMEDAGLKMVRYADDLVIFCRTRAEAESALTLLREELDGLRLELHPEKTVTVDMREPGGFDFLGYHFERGRRWPRKKSKARIREKIRQQTKRSNGTSLAKIIGTLNPVLRGWYEYYKHSTVWSLRDVDYFARRRIRAILRRRRGLRGPTRGPDHRRWPNAFFAAHGLFSLEAAHAAEPRPR